MRQPHLTNVEVDENGLSLNPTTAEELAYFREHGVVQPHSRSEEEWDEFEEMFSHRQLEGGPIPPEDYEPAPTLPPNKRVILIPKKSLEAYLPTFIKRLRSSTARNTPGLIWPLACSPIR